MQQRKWSLRAARQHRNLSVAQLASLVGLDRATVWRIETGRTTPRLDTWEALERILALPLRSQRRAA